MPRVDAFTVPGLDLWFNSDDHLPQHFHAEKVGHWEVRVFFLRHPAEMCQVVWPKFGSRGPGKRELRSLGDLAESHRVALLDEWSRKVNVKDPESEEPS